MSAPPPGYEIDEPEQARSAPPEGYELDTDKTDDPPQPSVPDKAPEPKTSIGDALISGGKQGLFGFGDEISAGIDAASDVAWSPTLKWKDTLERYRARKAEEEEANSLAQKEHPWAHAAGQLVTGIPSWAAGAAVMPGGLAARGAVGVGNLFNLSAINAVGKMKQGGTGGGFADNVESLAGEAAKDTASGLATGLMGQAIIRPTLGAAKAFQIPQKVAETGAKYLGGTRLGKWLGADAPELGENVSAEVRALRQMQDAGDPELGANVASQVQESLKNLGEMANKPVSLMSQSEVAATVNEMVKLYKARGADISPDVLMNFDRTVRGLALDPSKAKVADVIRGVNKRNASVLAAMAEHQSAMNDAIGTSATHTPSVQKMYEGGRAARAEYLTKNSNQFGQPSDPSQAKGVYQFGVDQLRPPSSANAMTRDAYSIAEAADAGRATLNQSQMSGDPAQFGKMIGDQSLAAKREAVDRTMGDIPGVGAAMNPETQSVLHSEDPFIVADAAARDARKAGDLAKAADMDASITAGTKMANRTRAENVDELHKKALEFKAEFDKIREAKAAVENAKMAGVDLDKIKTGRAAMVGAGAAVGGLAGAMKHGLLGTGVGAASGAGGVKYGLKVADLMGAKGQKLEAVASNIDKWAKQNDSLGRSARWALSGKPSSMIVRMTALFDLPEAQSAMSTE